MLGEESPPSTLVVAETEFLLQVLIIPLDAPLQLGVGDQVSAGCRVREGRRPVFRRLGLADGLFDQKPLLGIGFREPIVAVSRTNVQRREARSEHRVGALTPRDGLPSLIRQGRSDGLG